MKRRCGVPNLRLPTLAPASLLFILLASSSVLAQPPDKSPRLHDSSRHGPPGAAHILGRLDEALDLNDEQAAQLLTVLQEAEVERQALHDRIMSDYRPELCALRQETEAGILALLTPEQTEMFEQMRADRYERFGSRWEHGMADIDCDDTDG